MNNDHNDHARISCEETFTEDMGPATWANEPEQPQPEPSHRDGDYWEQLVMRAASKPEQPRPEPQPEPSHKEAHGRCEDAPCCGCCGGYEDDGYGSPADDAWHDANEYPDW